MDTPLTFDEKIARFLELLTTEQNAYTAKHYTILDENARASGRKGYHHFEAQPGQRFIKIVNYIGTNGDPAKDAGSVHTFVEKSSGVIFGAKSFKMYNPNHEYGTLDTIHEWDWSNGYAKHKGGKSSLVPPSQRR